LDEKYRKRDRYGGGIITDFKEKDSYKPNFKLEYVDDAGRHMNQKEAPPYRSRFLYFSSKSLKLKNLPNDAIST
jgi:hypothetical protein